MDISQKTSVPRGQWVEAEQEMADDSDAGALGCSVPPLGLT